MTCICRSPACSVDAYTLAFAVLMLSGGALGDRFGARRLYIAGLVLFALASLACGAANAPAMLIAARALQGVGAAAMLPIRSRCSTTHAGTTSA